jgi:putative ABC transport system permease protein
MSVALRGLAGRKLRSALTALAIVLGVAMISGTYVLTDTIKKGFDNIFQTSYRNADAVISGKVAFKGDNGTDTSISVPGALLGKVRALPDVAAAEGSIADQAKLVGEDGKTITFGAGSPNLAFSVEPNGDQRFNPLEVVSGRWPHGPAEIVIDDRTASKRHFKVGDTIGVATQGPVQDFTIVGTTKLSGASIGGATIAVFDLPTAQQLFHKPGELDQIQIAAKAGVSPQRLVDEIKPLLPDTAAVKTSAAQAKSDSKDTSSFVGFLQKFLLAFGGVALFVGAFVIANTLSITIAQRIREFATLRTLGASRRQILVSVVIEALVIGFLASVVGLFAGLGLAKGINALFVAIGIDLPKSGVVFAPRTIIVSLVVGTVITLVASLRPARRATKIAPIAAVREGAVLPPGRFGRLGPLPALVVLAAGIALLCYGVFGHQLATVVRIGSLALGTLIVFLGVALNAKRTVRPLAFVLGWPGTKLGGVAGDLARDNATRNPSRTASTAAALMIGMALITFVAVLGQGLRSSFEDAVDKLFIADYALGSQSGFDPIPKAAAEALSDSPVALNVSSVRAGDGRAYGNTIQVTAVDRDMSKVIKLDWYRGSAAVPAQLGKNGAFVEKKYAKDHHLAVGSPLSLETPLGKRLRLRLKGIFKAPKGGSPFGQITISTAAFDASYPNPRDLFAFIRTAGGVSPSNTAQLEQAVRGFPDAKIRTASQFKKNQESFLNKILDLLYVLLGLSVIISLFGIVNTLVLTVFERTRELGMLRAVGMTRRQVRRMIRHESIVTSLIGAALGIVVGIFLSLLVTQALSDEGVVFAVPYLTLVVLAVAAVVAGILAAILPARRASRLNVLAALQYE